MCAHISSNAGGLAQLGERYTGSVKVVGSNPSSSTFFCRQPLLADLAVVCGIQRTFSRSLPLLSASLLSALCSLPLPMVRH